MRSFRGYGFALPIIVVIVIIVGIENYSKNRHDSSDSKCSDNKFPWHSLDLGFVSLRIEPSALTLGETVLTFQLQEYFRTMEILNSKRFYVQEK